MGVDRFVERAQRTDDCLLESLQQQQAMLERQIHGFAGRTKYVGEALRTEWKGLAFEWGGAYQHGKSITELRQQRAVVCFAACGQFVQCSRQLVLAAVEQAQWLADGRLNWGCGCLA